MKVTTPRVESSVASTKTLKRRSSEIEQVRDLVSKGSSTEQMQHEFKMLSEQERESLLGTVLSTPVVISSDEVLAMKADLSITWNKLRDLRRYNSGCFDNKLIHSQVAWSMEYQNRKRGQRAGTTKGIGGSEHRSGVSSFHFFAGWG